MKEPKRHDLMKENLRQRLEIEQIFIDADHWNRCVRQPDEEKVNPDPDGQLAENWLRLHDAAIVWSEHFKPAMEKHYMQFRPCADLGNLLRLPNPLAPHGRTTQSVTDFVS